MGDVGKAQSAESMAHGVEYHFKVFWKFVIFRHKWSSLSRRDSECSSVIKFLIFKIITMLAFSKVDRRAIFRNCMNSFFEDDPEPSAIIGDVGNLCNLY